ncbi:MAG: hypothetical protein GY943_01285 [Chloroflexi bacterium]|nr:hypothetical protein [Chloroflexota bacterium]
MRNDYSYNNNGSSNRFGLAGLSIGRKTAVGAILIIALIAFEIFNFDTTQYALRNLLGDVRFLGMQWAAILAIAFCSIDFAGLIRLFTPERGLDEPKEVWYLMGAWLLGATMNAIMTWWAISLTLLNHGFGNEVLSRDQLLLYVPIFVAVLVWLTRILFIGAFTVAGEHIFDFAGESTTAQPQAARPKPAVQRKKPAARPKPAAAAPRKINRSPMRAAPKPQPTRPVAQMETQVADDAYQPEPVSRQPARPVRQPSSRVRQRPPRPNGSARRPSMQAKPHDRH